jgi:hypothetical protein
VVDASYLRMGAPPAVPEYTYFTLLPWPVILSVSLALDAAVVATAIWVPRWIRVRDVHLRVGAQPALDRTGPESAGSCVRPASGDRCENGEQPCRHPAGH